MLYWISTVKSALIINIAYFLICLYIFDRGKKKIKDLEIEHFYQISEKRTADNFDQTHRCCYLEI